MPVWRFETEKLQRLLNPTELMNIREVSNHNIKLCGSSRV